MEAVFYRDGTTDDCLRMLSPLNLFNDVKRLMPLHARKQYFIGMVQLMIAYGCVIWGSLRMNVRKMMKQYASIILSVKDIQQVSTVTLFCTLGWLPIDVRVRYFTAIVMYSFIHGLPQPTLQIYSSKQ